MSPPDSPGAGVLTVFGLSVGDVSNGFMMDNHWHVPLGSEN